jgi:two-component system, OmpR family, response regulator QseB
MRILIVEDAVRLAALLAEALAKHGFTCDRASTLSATEDALAAATYDAIILDIGLPDGDGLDWLRRKRGESLPPILALTARGTLAERIAGLDSGVDDYLTKPFATDEVAARLRALLRRPGARASPVLQSGALRLDVAARRATMGEAPLELSRRELDLLELLLRRAGAVVSREAIETALYSFDAEVTPNAVEATVSRLRKHLDEAGATGILHTIRGVGYLLEDRP